MIPTNDYVIHWLAIASAFCDGSVWLYSTPLCNIRRQCRNYQLAAQQGSKCRSHWQGMVIKIHRTAVILHVMKWPGCLSVCSFLVYLIVFFCYFLCTAARVDPSSPCFPDVGFNNRSHPDITRSQCQCSYKGDDTECYAVLRYAMLCYDILWYGIICYAMLCCW